MNASGIFYNLLNTVCIDIFNYLGFHVLCSIMFCYTCLITCLSPCSTMENFIRFKLLFMPLFELEEIFSISFTKYETRYIRIQIVICSVSFVFGEVFFFQLILLLALLFFSCNSSFLGI